MGEGNGEMGNGVVSRRWRVLGGVSGESRSTWDGHHGITSIDPFAFGIAGGNSAGGDGGRGGVQCFWGGGAVSAAADD